MEKISFGYVILHYKTVDDTTEAVNSIRKIRHVGGYKIVIVENGSQNASYEKLSLLFADSEDVVIVKSDVNLGFARGNNLGIEYCISHFHPDYIIALNNDIICCQDSMEHSIEDVYKRTEFNLLGPLVLTADGRWDSSPISEIPINKDRIKRNAVRERKLLTLETLHLVWLHSIMTNIKKCANKNKDKKKIPSFKVKQYEDVVPHGSFIVFHKSYFNFFADGFDNRTFLYHEEELLGLRIEKAHLKSVFCPDVIVFHKEDSSSKAAITGDYERRIFKLTECVKSSSILLSEIQNINKL